MLQGTYKSAGDTRLYMYQHLTNTKEIMWWKIERAREREREREIEQHYVHEYTSVQVERCYHIVLDNYIMVYPTFLIIINVFSRSLSDELS